MSPEVGSRPWKVTLVRSEMRPDPAGGIVHVTVVGYELTARPYKGEVVLIEAEPTADQVAAALDAEAARVLAIYQL